MDATDAVKLLDSQKNAALSAPIPFAIALALGATISWIAIRFVYNQRLTHHQELIANYQAVLEEKLLSRALRPFPAKQNDLWPSASVRRLLNKLCWRFIDSERAAISRPRINGGSTTDTFSCRSAHATGARKR